MVGEPTWWNAPYHWEWNMVYEMGLDVSVCGSSQIYLEVVSAHNSPVKTGDENVPIASMTLATCPRSAPIRRFLPTTVPDTKSSPAARSLVPGLTRKAMAYPMALPAMMAIPPSRLLRR